VPTQPIESAVFASAGGDSPVNGHESRLARKYRVTGRASAPLRFVMASSYFGNVTPDVGLRVYGLAAGEYQ